MLIYNSCLFMGLTKSIKVACTFLWSRCFLSIPIFLGHVPSFKREEMRWWWRWGNEGRRGKMLCNKCPQVNVNRGWLDGQQATRTTHLNLDMAYCTTYSAYQLHEWDPRPPGHTHQSCSRPACGSGQVRRDTSAGTTFPGQRHGHEP